MTARFLTSMAIALSLLSCPGHAQINQTFAERLGADPDYLIVNLPPRPDTVDAVDAKHPGIRLGEPTELSINDAAHLGARASGSIATWLGLSSEASAMANVSITLPDVRAVTMEYDTLVQKIQNSKQVKDAATTTSRGTTFEMSDGGLGNQLTREGWSTPDKGSRWTVGRKARLVFDLPPGQANEAGLRLTLLAKTFQDQTVEFIAGGQSLGTRSMSSVNEAMTFEIPASAVRNAQLEIILHLPDARSPQSVGISNDPRVLGLALIWIRLERQ